MNLLGEMTMQTIRYNIVEKTLDVPLDNKNFPNLKMGAYKTNFSTWIAEHAIIYGPNIEALSDCPIVRINSACFTGDIFGDRRCDCTEQLDIAMRRINEDGGLIIYHFHHEGRGLGFSSKLITYKKMMEEGRSTFEAMEEISNKNDLRTYGSAILILNDLGIKRIRLMTNNPNKKFVIESNGIEVVETIGVISKDPSITEYLQTKVNEQGHSIEFEKVMKNDKK